MSKNKFLLQFLADITNVKVNKAINSESTVLGAIKIAETHLNIIREDDLTKQEVYLPSMDNKTREKYLDQYGNSIYDDWAVLFQKLYEVSTYINYDDSEN